MKKFYSTFLMGTCFFVNYAWPFGIRHLAPITIVKSTLNSAKAKPFSTLAKGAILVGLGVWVVRFINDQRNVENSFATDEEEIHGTKFFRIRADGPVTVRAGVQKRPSIRMETIDLDMHTPSSEYQKSPTQAEHSWIKKVWHWICEPAHRRVNHYIVTVPADTPLKIMGTNKHSYAHTFKNLITVENMSGTTNVQASSGDIYIKNPGGQVTVKTPDSIFVENFHNVVYAVEGYSHILATRAKDNAIHDVYLNGQLAPNKEIYDSYGDEDN